MPGGPSRPGQSPMAERKRRSRRGPMSKQNSDPGRGLRPEPAAVNKDSDDKAVRRRTIPLGKKVTAAGRQINNTFHKYMEERK